MKNMRSTAAILSIFLLIPGGLVVNPAIQNLAEIYPEIPYATVLLLSTLPSLVIVPTALFAGAAAGSRLRYRTLLIASAVLFTTGGVFPYFMSNFYLILISRVVFGMGVGLASPLGNAIIMQTYEGQSRVSLIGIGTFVLNIASAAYFLLSGIVCDINVQYTWLIHLIGIISLVALILFLKEPVKVEKAPGSKVKIPVSVFVYAVAYGLIYMVINSMLLNLSTILISEKIGNATLAGFMMSIYTVGGIVAGAMFGPVMKITGRMTIPLFLLLLALALGFINFSHTITAMILGAFVLGMALFTVWPAVNIEVGRVSPPSIIALCSAMMFGAANLGGFLSTIYIRYLARISGNPSARLPIFAGMMLAIVIAMAWAGTVLVRTRKIA